MQLDPPVRARPRLVPAPMRLVPPRREVVHRWTHYTCAQDVFASWKRNAGEPGDRGAVSASMTSSTRQTGDHRTTQYPTSPQPWPARAIQTTSMPPMRISRSNPSASSEAAARPHQTPSPLHDPISGLPASRTSPHAPAPLSGLLPSPHPSFLSSPSVLALPCLIHPSCLPLDDSPHPSTRSTRSSPQSPPSHTSNDPYIISPPYTIPTISSLLTIYPTSFYPCLFLFASICLPPSPSPSHQYACPFPSPSPTSSSYPFPPRQPLPLCLQPFRRSPLWPFCSIPIAVPFSLHHRLSLSFPPPTVLLSISHLSPHLSIPSPPSPTYPLSHRLSAPPSLSPLPTIVKLRP